MELMFNHWREFVMSENKTFVDFLDEKSDCCGCHACYNACPKNCITMDIDNEGFWYPNINTEECIHCNMCQKVCPAVNKSIIENEPTSYIGYNISSIVIFALSTVTTVFGFMV